MSPEDSEWMQRCIDLAERGAGYVNPNPKVGCVIVHKGEILAEGWHKALGENHAERDAILKVAGDPRLKESILYVNLEPCAHQGRTPPCADLIVEHQIPEIVYGCRDPFSEVDGKGIEKLTGSGAAVRGPVLQKECEFLNRRFLTFHLKKRPYIILKWAETYDGFLAPESKQRTQISGHAARVLLHRWRSEEATVLVGAGTMVHDKPLLDVRFWPGHNPLPLVFDPQLKGDYSKFKNVLVFNSVKSEKGAVEYYKCQNDNFIEECISELYQRQLNSVLVEGGAETLNRFLKEGLWDEIRIIKSKNVSFGTGQKAPEINMAPSEVSELEEDTINIYFKS